LIIGSATAAAAKAPARLWHGSRLLLSSGGLIASVPFSTRLAVRDAIEQARRYIFLRAARRTWGLRFSAHVREILHAAAEKPVAAKQLTAPQDLFHLTRDELLAVRRGEKTEEDSEAAGTVSTRAGLVRSDGAVGRMDSGEETSAAEGALRGITICGGFVEVPRACCMNSTTANRSLQARSWSPL
jgi:hypothetical protein